MIEEDYLKKNINLTYFLSDLCGQILNDKDKKLLFKKKNEPLENFRTLSLLDEAFKRRYYEIFAKFKKSQFVESLEKQISNYETLLRSAKEFVESYFPDDSALKRELEEQTFGYQQVQVEESVCQDIFSLLEKQKQIEKTFGKNKALHFIYIIEEENEKVEDEEEFSIQSEKIKLVKREKRSRAKQQKIKGITIEYKTHRIKNNKTKLHYNFEEPELKTHLDDFALAILNHKVPQDQLECKTFKISWRNGEVQIKPSNNFIKRKAIAN